MPLEMVTCGWKGGLPPSRVESFSVTRLWKIPALAREDRLLVERVRMPDARLEGVVVRLGEAARLAAEQRQHGRVLRERRIGWRPLEAVSRQHDTVVARPADQAAGRRIDDRRLRRVVEARVEIGDVVGRRVPGRPVDPADAALDRQVVARLPGILHEHIGRQRAPLREVALAELGVVREQPEGGVATPRPVPPPAARR